MSQHPTAEDAHVLLELGQGFPRKEYEWFLANFKAEDYKEFTDKYPEGSTGRSHAIELLGFYELAGVLITHSLLDENLFFDIGYGIGRLGPKIEPIIKGWQKAIDPSLWENAFWLVKRYGDWKKKTWKPNLQWKKKTIVKSARR